MTFQYRVRDPLGNIARGTLEAASRRGRRAATPPRRLPGPRDRGRTATAACSRAASRKNEIIYVTSQLAIMVDTGITLSAALAGIVEQEDNPTLRKVLADLKRRGRGGRGFLRRPWPAIPNCSTRPTSRWSRPARRPARWARCSNASPATSARRSKPAARSARPWPIPAVMMVAGHRRDDLPADLHPAEVHAAVQVAGRPSCPTPTDDHDGAVRRACCGYWYSVAGRRSWPWSSASSIGKRTEPGRRVLDWVKINLPDRRPHVPQGDHQPQHPHAGHDDRQRRVRCSRRSGCAAKCPATSTTSSSGRRCSTQVTAGKRICEVLAGNPLFPSVLVQMIASGEETGKLDYVLERVSTYYDQEVETVAQDHHQPDRADHDQRHGRGRRHASAWPCCCRSSASASRSRHATARRPAHGETASREKLERKETSTAGVTRLATCGCACRDARREAARVASSRWAFRNTLGVAFPSSVRSARPTCGSDAPPLE